MYVFMLMFLKAANSDLQIRCSPHWTGSSLVRPCPETPKALGGAGPAGAGAAQASHPFVSLSKLLADNIAMAEAEGDAV